MEDSFKARVDRTFGSLSSSSTSSSSPLRSLWSLTDEEVEKREWNRKKESPDREEIPCSSSFDGFFANERNISKRNSRIHRKKIENDLQDLDDNDDEEDDEEDEQLGRDSPSSFAEGEFEIKSSIGLDCTLDKEEEEDEFDKVAVGREDAGDRLYMKDITDHGTYLNSHNVLPNSSKCVIRDPRANHLAAKIRLKEDQEATKISVSVENSSPAVAELQIKASEAGGNLKSILKRKENHTDSRSQKRVRFDQGCKDDSEELEEAEDFKVTCSMETTTVTEDRSLLSQDSPGVPDYIRNPSKYTCYSFDSVSEVDEESNKQAYMDLFNMMKMSNTVEGTSTDLPTSVTFIPKKRVGDASSIVKQNQEGSSKESIRRAGLPLGIEAEEAQESEATAMEEDEQEITTADKSGSSQKPARQYRMKGNSDESIS